MYSIIEESQDWDVILITLLNNIFFDLKVISRNFDLWLRQWMHLYVCIYMYESLGHF